jgi:hypothetical protein
MLRVDCPEENRDISENTTWLFEVFPGTVEMRRKLTALRGHETEITGMSWR